MIFPLPHGPRGAGVGVVAGWPISSWFGGRPNPFTGIPSWHGGMDLVAPTGTPMLAVVAGYVAQSWDPSGGGWWTTLYGNDGRRYGYGHASAYEPGVNGHQVDVGAVLAYVGSTGQSTGPHLHFAMANSHAGPWVDPYDALTAADVVGERPEPDPGPNTPPDPAPPVLSPQEALAMLVYWTIKGEPAFYAVGISDSLIGAVALDDGNPASPDHLVGGLFTFVFPNEQAFTLAAGPGVDPIELDPAAGHHVPLIDELRRLPKIYQAR